MNDFDDLLNNTPAPAQEMQRGQLSKEDYAAKKQAEREALYQLVDDTAQYAVSCDDTFRLFLDVQAQFSRYSAVNSLLIMAQMPEATRLGGFDYWKARGGFIRSGQTGIAILEPGKEYEKEDGSTGVSYNIKKVFDASQVDTRKMQLTPPPQYDNRQLLKALINKCPMRIRGVDELPNNTGATTTHEGDILVRKGLEFADTFRSIAYEMAQAELTTRLEISPNYAFAAYAATYILCAKYGVDTSDFDFASVDSVFAGMDAQEIKAELSQIHFAVDEITGRMAQNLQSEQRTEHSQEAR